MEIKISDLSYKEDLKNINLTINDKQVTTILSKNEEVKTNILNLISGNNIQDSGIIQIENFIIDKNIKKRELKKVKKEIYFMPEEYQKMFFNINVYEDIKYGIKNIDKNYLYELIEMFKMDKAILKRDYTELSDGELKKLLIINMLISNKEIIILENPTLGLDYKSTLTLIKLLKKKKREDKIILITSNDSDFILQVSDRIIVLDGKKETLDSNKYKILSNEKIINKLNMKMPKVIQFENKVKLLKNIKLGYRDNINDLLKDVYRNVR